MSECAYCKKETELYENGTPICVVCAVALTVKSSGESQIQISLLQEVREATDRVHAAAEGFTRLLNGGEMPPPDSTLQVTQASRELSAARAAMTAAHRRLTDFLSRGVVPEDLRRGPGDGKQR